MVIKMTKKYAVIENNKVINLVISDDEFAAQQGWVVCSDQVNIGWDYNGVDMVEPPRNINKEWAIVREKRNALLAQSDVAVLPDRWALMTPEKQIEIATYRQKLRDIPNTFTDPELVLWPVIPE